MDGNLARLEALLASQHGLITADQLRDEGIGNRVRRGLVERGALRRRRPGVYALVGAPESWERGLAAVVLSVDDSVASHSAAARLWQFAQRPEDAYEITVGRDLHLERAGVTMHRSGTIEPEDRTMVDGIPCTSFERTLCDCTTVLGPGQLGRVLDDGLRRRVATIGKLRRCAERLESGPGRHMSVVRGLLAERGVGYDPGGSKSELDVLDVIRRARLPLPVQQYSIRVEGRTYRPDFAWPEHRIFAEYYGVVFHAGASAVVEDSRRLTALVRAGWLPLVFTYSSSDEEIVQSTIGAFEQRGVRWKRAS